MRLVHYLFDFRGSALMARGNPPKKKYDLLMDWNNQEAIRYLLAEIEKAEVDTKPMRQPFELYQRLAGICVDGFVNDTKHKWEYKQFSQKVKDKCLEMVFKPNKMTNSWRGLYWELLRAETYDFFESFLYYMEMKRPFDKKFYEPRSKTLKQVVDDLQALEDGKYKFYGLSMPSRVGKELADDTPILTTEGWKNHGDLVVGDHVFNSKGEAVKVTYVHPKCQSTHIVTFSDGEEIECHENHEWIVYDRNRQETVTIETREMLDTYLSNECGNKRPRYSVNVRQPIIGEYKELPVDPYTLGAWLGDGTNVAPNITNDKDDLAIVDKIVKNGYQVSNTYIHTKYGTYRTSFVGLRRDLQKVGMCASHKTTTKHIPECYLTASLEQRLELLAGLIDTDGTLKRKENRYSFSTTEPMLAEGFKALVETFGWRVSVAEYAPRVSTSGIIGRKTVYRIDFNPTFEIPCVLKRKQIHKFSKQRRITIVNIRESEKKTQGNCISVEGGEYLAGKSLKPTHNSTICIFFLAWHALRFPNSHSALGGHSGILARGFYKELMNLITTEEYTFADMYEYWHPGHPLLTDKSADELTITLDEPDRFSTITCRGIDGTWTGAIDISGTGQNGFGYLYVDDLVRDRTHALSPTRMEDTFAEYLNKMVDRMNDGAKQLMVGTLWNILDPLKRLEEMYGNQEDYLFRKIPALNENDESNFDYAVHGFPTSYYLEMRDRLIRAGNEAEWYAKYQQSPYVREGLLFPQNELRFFNGVLPVGPKYNLVVVCDVAFGGGDSVSMPIGLKDEETGWTYIVDWYFNSAGVKVTVPEVADMLIKYNAKTVTFERNNGGLLFAKQVSEELERRNYICSCDTKPAPNNISKQDKIKSCEGKIKTQLIFLDGTSHDDISTDDVMVFNRSAQYSRAIDELSSFVTIGKNKNDDAPDSIAQLVLKAYGDINSVAVVETISRALLGF